MKATGIVRKVDELGRVVIPVELRRMLGINIKDGLEIFVDKENIVLRKYEPACIFCQSAENIVSYHGKNICSSCIEKINQKRISLQAAENLPAC